MTVRTHGPWLRHLSNAAAEIRQRLERIEGWIQREETEMGSAESELWNIEQLAKEARERMLRDARRQGAPDDK